MVLYKGVRITDTYFTGHKAVIYPSLVRSVSAICRVDRSVGSFYIGVASGPDHLTALKRRIDTKKIERMVSTMYLLYRSSSEYNTRSLENWLIEHYRSIKPDARLWNSAAGGGGRWGTGPHFFLYLAASRLPG